MAVASRVVGCELNKETRIRRRRNRNDRGKKNWVSPHQVKSANSFSLSGVSVRVCACVCVCVCVRAVTASSQSRVQCWSEVILVLQAQICCTVVDVFGDSAAWVWMNSNNMNSQLVPADASAEMSKQTSPEKLKQFRKFYWVRMDEYLQLQERDGRKNYDVNCTRTYAFFLCQRFMWHWSHDRLSLHSEALKSKNKLSLLENDSQ